MFFTDEDIDNITLDSDSLCYEEDDKGNEYVSATIYGLSDVGERIFGISLDSEKYSNAWIDVYADLKLNDDNVGICDRLTFVLISNTEISSCSKDDRDVYLSPTNYREETALFDQIAKQDKDIVEMLHKCNKKEG